MLHFDFLPEFSIVLPKRCFIAAIELRYYFSSLRLFISPIRQRLMIHYFLSPSFTPRQMRCFLLFAYSIFLLRHYHYNRALMPPYFHDVAFPLSCRLSFSFRFRCLFFIIWIRRYIIMPLIFMPMAALATMDDWDAFRDTPCWERHAATLRHWDDYYAYAHWLYCRRLGRWHYHAACIYFATPLMPFRRLLITPLTMSYASRFSHLRNIEWQPFFVTVLLSSHEMFSSFRIFILELFTALLFWIRRHFHNEYSLLSVPLNYRHYFYYATTWVLSFSSIDYIIVIVTIRRLYH